MDRLELPGVTGSAVAAGVTPAELDPATTSESVLIFGSGTEGNGFEGVESFAASTETLAERSVTAFMASPLCGRGKSKRIVASNILLPQ
jgi:hypothetical protein